MRSGSAGSTAEFVDTNVLIYAHDPADPAKQARAISLIERLTLAGTLALSAQVLNEFYTAATRPNKPPSLSQREGSAIIRDLVAVATVVQLTAAVTLLALEAVEKHSISFWDALVWAAAKEVGITTIHTEDVPGTPAIEGVLYVNPFVDNP